MVPTIHLRELKKGGFINKAQSASWNVALENEYTDRFLAHRADKINLGNRDKRTIELSFF